MVATANANAGAVQQGGHVVGMGSRHGEAGQGPAIRLLPGGRAVNGEAVNGLEAIKQVLGELLLPGVDPLQVQRGEVVQRRRQADGFGNGRGPRFKFVR